MITVKGRNTPHEKTTYPKGEKIMFNLKKANQVANEYHEKEKARLEEEARKFCRHTIEKAIKEESENGNYVAVVRCETEFWRDFVYDYIMENLTDKEDARHYVKSQKTVLIIDWKNDQNKKKGKCR